MNILYVNPNADLYGASRVLLRLIQSLNRQFIHKYRFIVVVPEEGPLVNMLREEGVTVRVLPFLSIIRRQVFRTWRFIPFLFFLLPSVVYLCWLIQREQIDIVHTNTGVILPSALASVVMRCPHIWHIHEMFSEEFPGLWKYYRPLIMNSSSRILCVSEYIAGQFPLCAKVKIIYNGLDTEEIQVDNKQVERWRNNYTGFEVSKLIGVVGRISPRKGQMEFLQACDQLKRKSYRRIRYLIIGDAFTGYESYVKQLRDFILEKDLTDDVEFVGFLDQPEALMAALDILVMPSVLPEAFPTVILEAMALGTPIVATNVGGITEQIEDGHSGILVPPASPEAIASALESLFSDPNKGQRLRQAGKRRLHSLFSLSTMSLCVHTIYEELVMPEKR